MIVKDKTGRELSEGDEVQVVDLARAKEYGYDGPIQGKIATAWPDGTVQIFVKGRTLGTVVPAECVVRLADVTRPEVVGNVQPILPPNPKAAFGAQKPDLALVPGVAIAHEAMAMENGASKYGPFNWRETAVEARTYVSAAKRHLDAWFDGQDYSSDTSPPVHNLGHARACLAIVLDAEACGNLIDNRPKPGKSAEVQDAMKAAKLAAALSVFGGGK